MTTPSGDVYQQEFERVAEQALGRWNRDPASPSFGSFDRAYWGWKYKDFSDATSQYAISIVIPYACGLGRADGLVPLLEGFVRYCATIQHRDGSFDQCYPYEAAPGVVYDILSSLLEVRGLLESSPVVRTLDDVIDRAVAFALRTDERHGEIANHFAQYAHELLHHSALTGDPRTGALGHAYVERTLHLFNPGEGWFREYDGPDPGYQTRTLRYLTKLAELLDDSTLWEVASKAATFVGLLLMPDNSIHPMLGARSTALAYASGFERLAARDPAFEPLADGIHEGWRSGAVPLPSRLDFSNAIRLGRDAWEAGQLRVARTPSKDAPGETKAVAAATLPKAGLTILRRPSSRLYVGHGLGGVVVAYARREGASWRLAYEDSGYLYRTKESAWLNRIPGAGTMLEQSASHVLLRAVFFEVLHEELTPPRLIALRTLNLSVLRSRVAGDLLRKVVVRRLMTRRRALPAMLVRRIELDGDALVITDTIEGLPAPGDLYRCRRVTGTHMASSRYFQPQELESLPLGWIEAVPVAGGRASQTVRVKLSS
jgi:hypothetical protein